VRDIKTEVNLELHLEENVVEVVETEESQDNP